MGCFDSVYVPCPRCGEVAEFQSKAGDCYLARYTLDNAPLQILIDIQLDVEICKQCSTPFHVELYVTHAARAATGLRPAPEDE